MQLRAAVIEGAPGGTSLGDVVGDRLPGAPAFSGMKGQASKRLTSLGLLIKGSKTHLFYYQLTFLYGSVSRSNYEMRCVLSSASRRRFLKQSASLAGKVATAAAVSLPILGSMSKKARALGWTGWTSPGPKCFLRGTLIRTPDGEIPVEELTIGSLVDTLRGPLPVKWIGRQRFEKTSPRWHRTVSPIRVAQFALSDQYPHRDLYLSPQHSLFMEGLLIPVERLVNGKSIALAAVDHLETIDYLHIELETHEVVFAEGAPAETLLITNDREQFPNFVEYERLYGADERPPMEPFAPVLAYNSRRDPLQRARARIQARAELIDS